MGAVRPSQSHTKPGAGAGSSAGSAHPGLHVSRLDASRFSWALLGGLVAGASRPRGTRCAMRRSN